MQLHPPQLVQGRSPKGLASLRSEQVVFHSPVVHTPQVGKAIATQYLTAAFHVFFNESFRYIREVVGARDAVLEFQVEIEGISVNGVDMIKWDDDGKIVEFKIDRQTGGLTPTGDTFDVTVDDATTFEWADGFTSDHGASADDLIESAEVASISTAKMKDGTLVAKDIVLVPTSEVSDN